MYGNRPPVWDAQVFPELQYDAYRIIPAHNTMLFPSSTREFCESLVTNFPSTIDTNHQSPSLQPLVNIDEVSSQFERNGRTVIDKEASNCQTIDALSVLIDKLDAKKLQFLPSIQTLAKKIRKDKTIREKNKMNHGGCVFCKNNNEPIEFVRDHQVRDATGKVTCPILRAFKCPICGETGDHAHTLKYCPQKPIITMRDTELAEVLGRAFQERYTVCN